MIKMNPRKNNIKNEIIQLLKNSYMGLSIRNISKKLNHSRITITKYLKILKKERLIIDQKVGQYRVWFFKDKNNLNINNSLIYLINNSILKNLTSFNLKKKDIKELGKSVAKEFNFSDYIDIDIENIEKPPSSKEMADRLMKIIDSICLLYDNYTWHPPILKEDLSVIVIRMFNSNLISNPNHFHLISGFIEYEINKYVKSEVNVIQIQENEKIVDFQFELFL